MKRFIAVLLVAAQLAGCATRLGRVSLTEGQTHAEMDAANTRCERDAALAWNENGKPFAAVLLGITIVGIPIAVSVKNQTKRRFWRECMAERGFRVEKS